MQSFGDAIMAAEMAAEPGKSPMALWYAQQWDEPREPKRRRASRRRMRRALARVLLAAAKALAAPERRERASA